MTETGGASSALSGIMLEYKLKFDIHFLIQSAWRLTHLDSLILSLRLEIVSSFPSNSIVGGVVRPIIL